MGRHPVCLTGSLLLVVACSAPRESPARRPDSSGATSAVTGAIPSRIDSLLARGDTLYKRATDSAGPVYQEARRLAESEGDSTRLARALTAIAQLDRVRGDFDQSRQLGEEALSLKLRLGMRDDLFRSYNALALLAWAEERLGDASALLRQATDAARATGDSAGVAKTQINMGLVLDDLGDFDGARAALTAGRDGARAAADTASLGRALTNLASLDIRLGDPLSGIASLEASRRLAGAAGDLVNEVNLLAQTATAYDALGEPQRAFAALDSALQLARAHQFRTEEADDVKIEADLYADAGDARRALDGYVRAIALDDSLGRPEERGDALRNEARVQFALGRRDLAARRAGDALRVHRSGGFRTAELSDLLVLAELSQAAENSREAESYLRSAQVLAATINVGVASGSVQLAEARVAGQAGDWSRVLRVLDAARASMTLLGNSAAAEALALRARAYARLGQLDAAAAAGRQALAAVERVRGNYATGTLRTSYSSDRMSVYVDLVLVLLRLGRADEALQVADAVRGRALLEHLTAARAGVATASPSERALLDADRLLRRIDELVAKLRQLEQTNPKERSAALVANARELADRIAQARGEYEALMARTPSLDAGSMALLGAAPANAAAIRASLSPGEVLLEYLVTPDRLLIFVADHQRLTTLSHSVQAADLAARVRLARELLAHRGADESRDQVLRALFDELILPVDSAGLLRDARRLVVVPHASLTYLPFAALIDRRSGHHLVEDFVLLHVPSAAALGALRTGSAASGGGVAAGAGFAPFPDQLPSTRREVQSFRQAVPGAATFIGSPATEQQLRRALEGEGVIHVATHGEMNARNPLFSRLALAPGRGNDGDDDGWLEVRELLGLHSRSPLVFLSGCETGLGAAWSTEFETGEDYTTIAQALLYAGARNVVATLWRIDDAAAGDFAARFYGKLRTVAVPEALADAQRAMLADPRYRSPYYWAAYEVSGGGRMGAY